MRPGESAVVILTLLILGIALKNKNVRNNFLRIFSLWIILLWTVQILVEGFRWQSWGLLAGSVLVLAGLRFRKAVFYWIAILSALLSVFLMYIFPIPQAVKTSGAYSVGTVTYHFVDSERKEIYADEPGIDREFVVQVWYPAKQGTGTQTKWMPNIAQAGPSLANGLGLPEFVLGHLKYALSNAEENAEPIQIDNGYPILVFSHGWTGFKEQNSALMEELASQGFVVVSINHTYGSILTVFPDGRTVSLNPDALPSGVSLEEYDVASNVLAKQWAEDIAYTIYEFKTIKLNEDLFLSEMIDFNRMGILGHSMGGAAALEFCYENTDCKAVFAMDPWLEAVSKEVWLNGIEQPALFLLSENWDTLDRPERNYTYTNALVQNSSGEILVATVLGTKHLDFTMLPMLSPVTEIIGLKGPIDGARILEIINTYAVTFFDFVFDNASPSPETLEEFPELLFGEIPAGS